MLGHGFSHNHVLFIKLSKLFFFLNKSNPLLLLSYELEIILRIQKALRGNVSRGSESL